MSPEPEPRYRASQRALLTDLGDGSGVLLDLETKFYFTLNETAIFLWRLLESNGGSSRAELAAAMTGAFEVDAPEADAAVDEVLDMLAREHLVSVG